MTRLVHIPGYAHLLTVASPSNDRRPPAATAVIDTATRQRAAGLIHVALEAALGLRPARSLHWTRFDDAVRDYVRAHRRDPDLVSGQVRLVRLHVRSSYRPGVLDVFGTAKIGKDTYRAFVGEVSGEKLIDFSVVKAKAA